MFERFTNRARRVVVLAQEEARLLNHNYIGTEHILLGLVHEGEGVAAKALEALGVSLEQARSEVKEIIGEGQSSPAGHIPFTPRAKKVLELALREALQLRHNYIGTEHILLGLLREGEGVGAQVLVKLGADRDRVRAQVVALAESGVGVFQETGSPSISRPLTPQLARAIREGPPPKLRGVVPIGRELELEPGGTLVLLSFEVWSEWIELRFAVVNPAEAPIHVIFARDAWRLDDDHGTEYTMWGTASSGADLMLVAQFGFEPSPPPEARRLTLTVPAVEQMVEVDLDLPPGEEPPGAAPSAAPG